MTQNDFDNQSTQSETVGNINISGSKHLFSIVQGNHNRVIQILLEGITLQFPSLSDRQKRFSRAVAIGIYISCILAGFSRLIFAKDAALYTRSLLIVGSSLLALTYCYYAWPWNLKIPEKKAMRKAVGKHPQVIRERTKNIEAKYKIYEEEYKKEKKEVERQILRKKTVAIMGAAAISLTTYGGFCIGKNVPVNTIVTIADYFNYNDNNQDLAVTNAVRNNLRETQKEDVSVQSLEEAFQTPENARKAGNDRFSTITIWGLVEQSSGRSQQQERKVITNFELLKSLPDLPKEAGSLKEEEIEKWSKLQNNPTPFVHLHYDNLPLYEVNASNVKPLTSELSYLIWFISGLAHYRAKHWDSAINGFDTALKHVASSGSLEPGLDKSFVYLFRSNTEARKANASKSKDGYDSAIDGYTRAIQLIKAILQKTQVSYTTDNLVATQNDYRAVLASYPLISKKQSGSDSDDDDQENICADRKRDEPLLVDSSPSKLKPYLARIYYNRGVAYAMGGNPEKALADYAKALKLDPEMDKLCIALGTAYKDLTQYAPSAKNFDRGFVANPKDPSLHNNLGNLYVSQGDTDQNNYKRAIQEYTKAINIKPDFIYAYLNRGRAYVLQGNKVEASKALEDFDKAISLNSNFAEAYYGRGVSRSFQESIKTSNSKEEALVMADFNKALKLKPNFAEVYLSRGRIHLNQSNVSKKDYYQVIQDFNDAIRFQPSYSEPLKPLLLKAYYGLAEISFKDGEYEKAIINSSKAIQLSPDSVEAYKLRARAYIAQKKYASATLDADMLVKLEPSNIDLYNTLGDTLLEQGDIDNAIAIFQKAIKLKPDYSEVYYKLGKAFFDQKNYSQSISELKKAIEKDSSYAEAYNLRARVYYLQNEYEKAIKDLNSSVTLDSAQTYPYYNLGLIYAQTGKTEAAIENFTKANQIGSDQALQQDAETKLNQIYLSHGYAVVSFTNKEKSVPVTVTIVPSERTPSASVLEFSIDADSESGKQGLKPGIYQITVEFPEAEPATGTLKYRDNQITFEFPGVAADERTTFLGKDRTANYSFHIIELSSVPQFPYIEPSSVPQRSLNNSSPNLLQNGRSPSTRSPKRVLKNVK